MDGREWKRRRLVHPDGTRATFAATPDSSAFAETEVNHSHGTLNSHLEDGDPYVDGAAMTDLADANIVCYGMLENLPITSIATATVIDNPILVFAYLNENGLVQRSSDGAYMGKLEDRAAQCLLKLGDEEHVEIQLMFKTIANQTYRKRGGIPVALASAIIYGPEELSDDIGEFLDRCDCVLQDPFGCERNVPYKNPHCLSSLFETPRMTFELHNSDPCQNTFTLSRSLKALETTDDLPEWPQPAALKTELHRHQKQALSFFIRRERMESMKHIWQVKTLADGSSTYINGINGSYQNIPPPNWNGGILADDMGLGKTLQMISLIAADKYFQQQPQEAQHVSAAGPHMATLVVVPFSLISVWEYQLGYHLHPSTLTWRRHHRKSRFTTGIALMCPDVVITTYQTVQSKYKRHSSNSGSLFGHQWRRIILDEAHNIRNKTVTSSAVSELKAVSRWAVTGTPIQNSLADICGLLSFLRFRPYDSTKSFDEDIIECFRRGNIEEGTRRLKALCQPIMIRRPKSVIVLPTRQDLIKEVDFSADERQEYQKVEASFQKVACNADEFSSEAQGSMSAIQLINKLRLVCNLGVCSTARTLPIGEQTNLTTPEIEDSAETIIASEVALGSAGCEECHEIIDILDTGITTGIAPYAYYSQCCRLYCSRCVTSSDYQTTKKGYCCDKLLCLLRPLSSKLVRKTRNDELPTDMYCTETSKIRALVQGVLSGLPEKSVVFSFWTSSLTMAQKALTTAGIRCVRIDGSISLINREKVLQEFNEDEGIKVILVTISCGGVGLDLTAASRVHLLEPQWNPAVEDQALARVHRMGQHRPVVTIRYVMKNSIEESITSLKGKKRLLADLLPQTSQSLRSDQE
ncbi:hypothetical protein F4801DRAFT_561360 [Xylaria longipes]|nr:hypothetical protein F4801DRAFT_561360 [Xylaria longipes]